MILNVVLFVLLGGVGVTFAKQNWPTLVQTDRGWIEGLYDDKYRVLSFLGVPYAAPPINDLRWRIPRPHDSWTGVRSAQKFGAVCAQVNNSGHTFPAGAQFSEDCLTLNIWTPVQESGDKLPVSVWIHGGALTQGSGSEPRLTGTYMAREGNVVVVNINYRLNVLGFLALPQLLREAQQLDGVPTTGNYGLLDQRRALEWVHDNIALFGGDNEQVTIFGESAGGGSVMMQLVMQDLPSPRNPERSASPLLSTSLFHRAIAQSPPVLVEFRTLANAESVGQSIVSKLNCSSPDDTFVLACMRSKSWRALMPSAGLCGSAAQDGVLFSENPLTSFANNRFRSVPLMEGNTLNDGNSFAFAWSPNPTTDDQYAQMLKESYGARVTSDLLALYPCADYNASDCRFAYSQLFGDRNLICPGKIIADFVAAQRSSQGLNDVYGYVFAHVPSWVKAKTPWLGAYHATELEFVFSTLTISGKNHTIEEEQLAREMTDYWTAFIRNGDPNLQGQTPPSTWPLYSSTQQARLFLDSQYAVQTMYEDHQCAFWKKMYGV
eukprot:TRINITY_DN2799_c0_g1_i1.p1 TRINITY_DN2799_c0_g1~~TRINITY_DN2799_c0_g1_i1.p1  ORF type:complete len:548 (-),score=69.52 TRINITY_DN2799_c0_g1_i1:349-1992(-)